MLLGMLGLRVGEACVANIEDLGMEHGHPMLLVHGKGSKNILMPSLPAVTRAIDPLVGNRRYGPIPRHADSHVTDVGAHSLPAAAVTHIAGAGAIVPLMAEVLGQLHAQRGLLGAQRRRLHRHRRPPRRHAGRPPRDLRRRDVTTNAVLPRRVHRRIRSNRAIDDAARACPRVELVDRARVGREAVLPSRCSTPVDEAHLVLGPVTTREALYVGMNAEALSAVDGDGVAGLDHYPRSTHAPALTLSEETSP